MLGSRVAHLRIKSQHHWRMIFISIATILLLFGLEFHGYFGNWSGDHSLVSAATQQRHFGWWVDENNGPNELTPQQFFDNYFLTPPYPSGMLFVTGVNDPYWSNDERISWFNQLASIADQYPNIRINVMMFVNISGVQLTATCNPDPYDQSSQTQQFIVGIEGHTSVYGIIYEPEYFGNTLTQNKMFDCWVRQAGYTFIESPGMSANFPNNPVLGYCEFPWFQSMGDSMEACAYNAGNTPSSQQAGIGFGEYTNILNFPVAISLNPNPNLPAGCTLNSTGSVNCNSSLAINGWNKQVVQSIVDDSLKPNLPPSSRQFVYVYSGGVGKYGQNATWSSTNIDGQMMRNWVWSDPNYELNYALSDAIFTPSTSVNTTTDRVGFNNSSQETSQISMTSSTLTNSSASTLTSLSHATTDSSNRRKTESSSPLLLMVSLAFPLVAVSVYAVFIYLKKSKRTNLMIYKSMLPTQVLCYRPKARLSSFNPSDLVH